MTYSRTIAISSGKESRLCPGINLSKNPSSDSCLIFSDRSYHVVVMPYFLNIFRSRGTPTSAAKHPREMSPAESSPPYDPSQPALQSSMS
jgi:hypothetical protein